MKTLNEKISNLKPSEILLLSEGNGIKCTAERSANGKDIRYVRTYSNGSWVVFHKTSF